MVLGEPVAKFKWTNHIPLSLGIRMTCWPLYLHGFGGNWWVLNGNCKLCHVWSVDGLFWILYKASTVCNGLLKCRCWQSRNSNVFFKWGRRSMSGELWPVVFCWDQCLDIWLYTSYLYKKVGGLISKFADSTKVVDLWIAKKVSNIQRDINWL